MSEPHELSHARPGPRAHAPLKRLLGTPTAWLLGLGVAIGSGIFRTPGQIAGELGTPGVIVLAWVLGGLVVLMQGLVSAELATRFPRAGGEYVFLKEAYGEFAAFFFGWAYTVFIIGGGAAGIARALGDFACELTGFDPRFAGPIAGGAILLIVVVNALGLRSGAGTQNTLTTLKIVALLSLIVVGFVWGQQSLFGGGGPASVTAAESPVAASQPSEPPTLFGVTIVWFAPLLAALLPILWSYDGLTDSVKLAEEIKDVRRAIPRAIIGSTLTLIALYALVNGALLRVIPADEMSQHASAPGAAMSRLFGEVGGNVVLVVAILVCLGALSSTILATIRVTFALARDGLAPGALGRMSKSQAPVGALVVIGVFATVLAQRDFSDVLGIYFFASAMLFGLSYLSLIVFRLRESAFPDHAFRCPAGFVLATILILIQIALAAHIAYAQPRDVLGTTVLLAVLGLGYGVWKVVSIRRAA